MGYYQSDFLEQVRYASDIVSLISEDTVLKGQGDRFMGLCPFPEHNEKTPSFSVSGSKQLYHCFGCQNAGNIFTYLQKQRGMSFFESVEYLARKAGIALPQTTSTRQARWNPGFFDLSEKICKFYEQQLIKSPLNHPIRNYLKKRGWTEELIKSFRLGYAPKGNALLSFLNSPKEKKLASELGLLNSSPTGEYDNFRHRLIFPIISTRKQVIGFGARVLDNSLPKYINSKESKIFHKGEIFYGLNESARYLRQDSSALIVEGYTDFLSLWQEGFRNLIATLGTALTNQHARALKRYVNSVILIFDGDTAGLKASERSLPLLLAEGLKVKFLFLPKDQDPDDFIRSNGKQAFQSRLQSAKDLFFFVLQKKQEELKNKGQDKLHLIEQMAPLLAVTQNTSLQVVYKQRLLDLFGNDARLVEKTLNEKLKNFSKTSKTFDKSQKINPPAEPAPSFSLAEALDSERLLLVLCLESEYFLKKFLDLDMISFLKTKGIIRIFNKIEEHYRQNPNNLDKFIHLIMNEISNPSLIFKASYPIFNEANQESQKKIFQDCVYFLKNRRKHNEASELLAEMKMNQKEDIHHLEKVFQLTKQRLTQGNKPKA